MTSAKSIRAMHSRGVSGNYRINTTTGVHQVHYNSMHNLRIKVYHRNQPNESELAQCKL